ncbi:hypothetical protein [Actinoallomurus sp. NPDC052274]|uniref:hypothetical protein n=1 Tax=Actinoallomurus sp. NPDC052274 TaxID=3155420 RepID=UPI00342E70AD
MPSWSSRTLTALSLTAAALTAVPAAHAAPRDTAPHAAPPHAIPLVPVEVTADGFCAATPDPLAPGPVTFRVSTPVADGRWWSVLRLRGTATMDQVAAEFGASYSTDPAVALPALRGIYRDVDFNGGASVFPAAPVSVTTHLEPGTYYLSDTALNGATDGCGGGRTHLQRVQVAEGPRSRHTPLRYNGTVDARETPAGQRFAVSPRLSAHAVLRVTDHTRQPHELIIAAVRPGTTDEDVQAYLDALRKGDTTSVPDPFGATAGGMLAISPGHEAIFRIDLKPGRYSLLSFVRNPQTGVKSAFEGMHTTVTFH